MNAYKSTVKGLTEKFRLSVARRLAKEAIAWSGLLLVGVRLMHRVGAWCVF